MDSDKIKRDSESSMSSMSSIGDVEKTISSERTTNTKKKGKKFNDEKRNLQL